MEDLLQTQIKEICKLQMPDGLKELMSDISREVLRAQPTDIYRFIADYLSALLVTRDNLYIGSQICTNVYNYDCRPELYSELRDIGLSESDAKIAQDFIFEYFSKNEKVKEGNLLAALLEKTTIDDTMFPGVIEAIRAAYLSHQAHNFTKYETSSESDQDEVAAAAAHTLNVYRETEPTEQEYGEMTDKIQTSYRAYGVRRNCMAKGNYLRMANRPSPDLSFCEEVQKEIDVTASMNSKRIHTDSSFSLAGSLYELPRQKPYSAHDDDSILEFETSEREHAHIDYTARSPHLSLVVEETFKPRAKTKRISFQNDSEIEIRSVVKQVTDVIDEKVDNFDNSEMYFESYDTNECIEEEINGSAEYSSEEIDEEDKNALNYVSAMNENTDSDSGDVDIVVIP